MNVEADRTRDRFVNRRNMAWKSFCAFSTMGVVLILLGLYDKNWIIGIWPQANFSW